jgi:hypothetical protein
MKTAALQQAPPHFGLAWITLGLALGVHVSDEALNDFLSAYNPTVLAIREKLPFLLLPAFTFGVWGLAFFPLRCCWPVRRYRSES